jgi:UDP-N-acetylmuramate dehydrogenase
MRKIFEEIKGLIFKKDFPLSKISSIGIGGKIKYFLKIKDKNSLLVLKEFLKKEKYLFVGKLTNILFSDGYLDGVVIQYQDKSFEYIDENPPRVRVGAGINLTNLILMLPQFSLSGLEPLVGIPGSLGGAVKMNAGAFGVTIADFLEELEIFSLKEGFKTIRKKEINFNYRFSSIRDDELIVSAVLILEKKGKPELIQKYLKMRNEKFPKGKSLGCIFKNPEELPAGKLIEATGLKNFRVNDAIISEKHANFILNLGKAKFLDVYELIQIIKEKVYERFNILLTEEIKIVDF